MTAAAELRLPYGCSWDLVPVMRIMYIEVNDKFCRIVTVEKEYSIKAPLSSFETSLPETHFMRIHRNYIVCFSSISSIGKTELIVAGQVIPISKRMLGGFNSRYPKYLAALRRKKE